MKTLSLVLAVALCTALSQAAYEPVFCISSGDNAVGYVHQGGTFQFGLDLPGDVSYDDQGRIEKVQTARIRYDDDGRVERIRGTRVSYDDQGRVERIGSVRIRYNSDGNVDRIGSSQVSYWPDGRIKRVRGGLAGLPSDFVPVMALSVRDNVIALIDANANFEFGAARAGTTYFNDDGRVRSVGGASISFDDQDRVTRVAGTRISYDDDGRVTRIGSTSISYDDDGRIRQIGSARIWYDDEGRVRKVGRGVQVVGQGN